MRVENPEQAQEHEGQKWEYLFIKTDAYGAVTGASPMEKIDDPDLKDQISNAKSPRGDVAMGNFMKLKTYAEVSNQLGDLGWELVNVSHTPNTDFPILAFKRPKTSTQSPTE